MKGGDVMINKTVVVIIGILLLSTLFVQPAVASVQHIIKDVTQATGDYTVIDLNVAFTSLIEVRTNDGIVIENVIVQPDQGKLWIWSGQLPENINRDMIIEVQM